MLFVVLQLIIIDDLVLIFVDTPCLKFFQYMPPFSCHLIIIWLLIIKYHHYKYLHVSSQIMFQTVECSLYGILPSRDTWTDHAVEVSTQLGLATGEVYTVTCMEIVQNTNRVMLTLPGLCQILLLPIQPLIPLSIWFFAISRIWRCALYH